VLIKLLRACGVTEYTAPNGLTLKLGALPNDDVSTPNRVPVISEGGQKFRDAMKKLDPIYSDPSLFEIR
jgi:hypothetical protein